ncbi:hypothetical protein HBI56_209980 [Parastagonospora nodorum]|nr:hypothetical protein HBH52_233350 [Parastagonospora nodorum]KAH3991601.1 hypothetical protein HBI10_230740 [Parastagonospora nodorum]KAH4009418.1 hypothetical protein HBI13_218280 [Parastagonospora nodorum]KAH4015101.1 hypothetical protein HBI09_206790 [Parastagonospora nodorum]KAH4044309.1 hypothetical protein HBH49_217480 [Parastagonospora nodorum]
MRHDIPRRFFALSPSLIWWMFETAYTNAIKRAYCIQSESMSCRSMSRRDYVSYRIRTTADSLEVGKGCLPERMCANPSCAGANCQVYKACGSGCLRGSLTRGGKLCVPGTTPCSSQACSPDPDCDAAFIRVVNTCCRGRGGICVKTESTCGNSAAPKMLFARRPATGDTVMK